MIVFLARRLAHLGSTLVLISIVVFVLLRLMPGAARATSGTTFDAAKRKAIYADLQKRLFEDAPWLFMYRATSFTGVSERVKEIHTLAGPEFHYLFPIPPSAR